MNLKKLILYQYSLPLQKPIKMKGTIQNFRNGLILELIDENGNSGFGDIAPFPGLHKESIAEIIDETKILYTLLAKIQLDYQTDIWSQLELLPDCLPSLQFALDWSVVDLFSKIKKIPPAQLFNSKPNERILLNALLSGTSSEVLKEAKKLKDQNYQTVKLKVAHSINDEINLVLKLNDIFEGQVNLRLDANQSWTTEQAMKFGKAIQSANIEYIEEPCNKPELLSTFYIETGIQYAFDETISQGNFEELQSFDGLNAIIIKPSVIGKLSKTKKWIEWANQKKVKVVFSSVFESGIGLQAIANLAGAFGNRNVAHGIETFRWLKEDVTKPPFTSEASFIQITNQTFSLNNKSLNMIYEYNF